LGGLFTAMSLSQRSGPRSARQKLTAAAGLCLVGCTLGPSKAGTLPVEWRSTPVLVPERPPLPRVVVEAKRRPSQRGMRWAPMPSPQQVWAHSCVTRAKLEAALKDPDITAIEVDVAMGYLTGPSGSGTALVPVMAHPPVLTSDLSFETFLDEVIRDGRRHVKFDFKDLEAVQLCLPLLAEKSQKLAANGQAVWLNADVLPGPGLRGWRCAVPADAFFEAAQRYCPGAHLSLGWKANPVGLESYTEADCKAMAELLRRHRQSAKGGIVFAVAARAASKNLDPLVALLSQVPGSQLLFWTGTWEPPILVATKGRLREAFAALGLGSRCGFDVRTVDPPRLFLKWMAGVTELVTGISNTIARALAPQLVAIQ